MSHPYFDNTSAEQQLRDERFRLLDLTDWTQTNDAPLSDEKKEECRNIISKSSWFGHILGNVAI